MATSTQNPQVAQMTPRELKARIDAGEALLLLDVREPWELAIARVSDALNIPMNEIPERVGELDPQLKTVVLCRSGVRSQRVAEDLAARGFASVHNLSGGILRWAAEVDPRVASY